MMLQCFKTHRTHHHQRSKASLHYEMEEGDSSLSFETLMHSQREELIAAQTLVTDLDLAFRLQLEEAMTASLSLANASSSQTVTENPIPIPSSSQITIESPSSDAISLQTLELDRLRQQTLDSQLSRNEMSKFLQEAHDLKFARKVADMEEEDWDDYGDEFHMPMNAEESDVRVYFKGLSERVEGREVRLAGIGVAVCDESDKMLFRISKSVDSGNVDGCRERVEMMALIEALKLVVGVGWKKVDLFMDYRVLFKHVIGKWTMRQRKLLNMLSQIQLLREKLDECNMHLVPRCDIKHVFKLARDAIELSKTLKAEQKANQGIRETCIICLEDIDVSQMFVVTECLHRFCLSCMKQHAEIKLLHGMLPCCPHEACKIKLKVENCGRILTPKLQNIMVQRLKEESIPVTQKIYCPYPKCSALMSCTEALKPRHGSSSKQPVYGTSGLRNCIQCGESFCIYCKVPWHDRMSCANYQKSKPQNQAEDNKLKALAKQNLWRQCIKCNHMIELAEGCFHMTCRCGYEFCYTCGAEYRNKEATCSCPLFLDDDDDEDSDDFEDSDEEYDDDDDEYDDDDDDYESDTYSNVMHLERPFLP